MEKSKKNNNQNKIIDISKKRKKKKIFKPVPLGGLLKKNLDEAFARVRKK